MKDFLGAGLSNKNEASVESHLCTFIFELSLDKTVRFLLIHFVIKLNSCSTFGLMLVACSYTYDLFPKHRIPVRAAFTDTTGVDLYISATLET